MQSLTKSYTNRMKPNSHKCIPSTMGRLVSGLWHTLHSTVLDDMYGMHWPRTTSQNLFKIWINFLLRVKSKNIKTEIYELFFFVVKMGNNFKYAHCLELVWLGGRFQMVSTVNKRNPIMPTAQALKDNQLYKECS